MANMGLEGTRYPRPVRSLVLDSVFVLASDPLSVPLPSALPANRAQSARTFGDLVAGRAVPISGASVGRGLRLSLSIYSFIFFTVIIYTSIHHFWYLMGSGISTRIRKHACTE